MLAIMLANSRRGPPLRVGSGHKFASPRSVRPPFSLIGHPPPASPPMRWRHHQRRPLSSFMGPPPRPPRWSRRCAPDRTWRTCGSSTSTPMATGATQESAADGLHSRRRALPGGKPIITLFSRAMGQQGLASRHPPATRVGMVSTRGDVHGVITGYARSISTARPSVSAGRPSSPLRILISALSCSGILPKSGTSPSVRANSPAEVPSSTGSFGISTPQNVRTATRGFSAKP
jgi:hypothetical protein